MNQQQWQQPGHGPQFQGPPHQGSAPGAGRPGPQQQWGQQPNAQWQQPAGKPGKKRLGPILMLVGAVVGCLAVVLGLWGGFGSLLKVMPATDEVHAVTQPLQVTLEEDQEMAVWIDQGSRVQCTVVDEAGALVQLTPTGASYTRDDLKIRDVGKWSGAGTYTVECDSAGGYVAQPMGVGALVGGVSGILAATFGGLIGGTLFIVGLIVWLVQRKR